MRCHRRGISRSGTGASRLRKALELAVEARHLVLGGFWGAWVRTRLSAWNAWGQLLAELLRN